MKKKLFFFATLLVAVVAAFGLTSCSQEDMPDTPTREGMVDVVMTTSMPQELQTYGVNSAEGGLKNLENKEGYAVRYIMEIYPEGSITRVQRMIKYVPITADGTYRNTFFQTRLLAAKYKFVFFADIVKKVNSFPYGETPTGMEAPYYCNRYFLSNINEDSKVLYRPTYPTSATPYVEGDLQNICASFIANSTIQNNSPEMYDAYSCTESVDLRKEPIQQEFVLKRPFAKLRLIATDADQLLATPDWSKSLVNFTASNIPTGFNALTGESVNIADKGYWDGNDLALNSETYTNEGVTEKTIGVFYLPVPAKSQNLTFSITVKDASGKELAQGIIINVENVPLVGNKLTTIKGNLLSKNPVINVRIDDEFEDNETIIEYGKEASTVDALKAAMTGKDETITFTGKVSKDQGFELDFSDVTKPATYAGDDVTPVYGEGNTATLTLAFASIEDGAVLTFKGDNAPKTLCIKTDTKCSLRINLPKTDINYDGSAYKYIVTNAGCKTKREGAVYEVMFRAGNGSGFYSYTDTDYDESHLFKINADFTLPANIECLNDIMHQSGSCNWASSLTAGTNVWDFVGNTKN